MVNLDISSFNNINVKKSRTHLVRVQRGGSQSNVFLVVLLVAAVLVILISSAFLSSGSVVSPHVLGQMVLSSKSGTSALVNKLFIEKFWLLSLTVKVLRVQIDCALL